MEIEKPMDMLEPAVLPLNKIEVKKPKITFKEALENQDFSLI